MPLLMACSVYALMRKLGTVIEAAIRYNTVHRVQHWSCSCTQCRRDWVDNTCAVIRACCRKSSVKVSPQIATLVNAE